MIISRYAVVAAGTALLTLSACSSTDPSIQTGEADLSARQTPACMDPPKKDCGFYSACLEGDRPCGADGYALGYGDKYCRRFLASSRLSDKGVTWRDETMYCLQKRLTRFLGNASATCEAIIDGAFDDHPVCYTQPHASICALPWTDWLEIIATIDLGDLVSRRGRKQIAATAGTCIKGWFTPPWMRPKGSGDEAGDEASDQVGAGADPADDAAKSAMARELEADPDVPLDHLREVATTAHGDATKPPP